MKKEPCRITVPIPKGADVEKIESAVEKALESKLTDATLRDCKEITIFIKFNKHG